MVRVRAVSGGSGTNIAVFNDQGGVPVLEQVSAEATGGTSAYGIRNRSTAAVLSDVEAAAFGGTSTYAVSNASCAPAMTGVTAVASGGTYNYGVYNSFASPRMTRVNASATGGNTAIAVFNYNGSSPDIRDLTATATLATSINAGVQTWGSTAVMRWVQAEAKGPGACYGIANEDAASVALFHVNASASEGTGNYGVHNNNGPLAMFAVTGTAKTSDAYGLFLLGQGYSVSADNCVFSGTSRSVYKVSDVILGMGACFLDGPVNDVGQYQCVECFNESATPLDDECQPVP